MHDGAVGSSGGNGREAEIAKPRLAGIFLVQHLRVSELADALSNRELAFEACQAADLGRRSVQMGIAHGSDLGGIFHRFH